MWRACHNSLPSKCNLFRRRIISEQCCDRCKAENEDTVHAVWSCKMLDDIWSANNSWNFQNQQYFSSFSELMVWILDHQRNPALFAFTVWSVWHQRNQSQTRVAHWPLNLISQWAHDNWVEFKAQNSRLGGKLQSRKWWKLILMVPSLPRKRALVWVLLFGTRRVSLLHLWPLGFLNNFGW